MPFWHFIRFANFICPQGQISLQIIFDYLPASSIATATATVIPTMGLLPVATAFIYRRLVSSTDISVELFFVIYRMVKHEERLIIIS